MEHKPKFDVYYYLGVIKRRKWFLIVPLVVVVVSSVIASNFVPKVYRAKATIVIDEQKVMNPLLERLAVSTTVAQRIEALREEILSWPKLFQVAERLGLNKGITDAMELEVLIGKLRKDIDLEMKASNLIVVSYSSGNPEKTKQVVNTLCDVLITSNSSTQQREADSAINFIKEQLDIYKGKLQTSESALRKFKEVYGSGIYSSMDEAAKPGKTLVRINEEIGTFEADLMMAKVECTDDHPRVVELKRKIGTLKATRNAYIKQLASSAGVDTKEYLSIADSLPRQEEELAQLTRDYAVNEKMYTVLLERLESAQITDNLENSDERPKFRIIEPARLPVKPIKPNKVQFNLVGLMLGSALGFGFVYFLEYTDSSFKRDEDIRSTFGSPVLGNISKIVTEGDLESKKEFNKKILMAMGIGIVIITIIVIIVTNL